MATAPAVDRARLVAWLLDRARDEDETAQHKKLAPTHGGVFDFEYWSHADRAKLLRDVAAAVERGDPDSFEPPDLDTPKRKSGEHAAVTSRPPRRKS